MFLGTMAYPAYLSEAYCYTANHGQEHTIQPHYNTHQGSRGGRRGGEGRRRGNRDEEGSGGEGGLSAILADASSSESWAVRGGRNSEVHGPACMPRTPRITMLYA